MFTKKNIMRSLAIILITLLFTGVLIALISGFNEVESNENVVSTIELTTDVTTGSTSTTTAITTTTTSTETTATTTEITTTYAEETTEYTTAVTTNVITEKVTNPPTYVTEKVTTTYTTTTTNISEETVKESTETSTDSNMTYCGVFKATWYDNRGLGYNESSTLRGASGRELISGYSVASNYFASGTLLYIKSPYHDGLYRVDDTGGMADNVIDFYYQYRSDIPYNFMYNGVCNLEVYVVN